MHLSKDRKLPAEYLGKDEDLNLAFLKITSDKAKDLPHATFNSEHREGSGDPVIMLSPLPEHFELQAMARVGRVVGRL